MTTSITSGLLPAAFVEILAHSPIFGRRTPHKHQAATLSKRLRTLQHPDPRQSSLFVAKATNLEDTLDRFDPSNQPLTLTGVWRKDLDASDSMEEACDMVKLPYLLRKALLFLSTLHLEETDIHFKTVLKAGGILDVVERYPWDSLDPIAHPRRDKRSGKHMGRVSRTEDGHPVITVTWDEPYGGICSDRFQISRDGKMLEQWTEMRMNKTGRETTYKTVYRRV